MLDEGNVQNAMTLSDGQQAVVDTLAVPGKALMDIPQIANGITEGVNAFMDVVPGIVKALDGLATIHPFIAGMGKPALNIEFSLVIYYSVAVSAFKAVYALEMTRRGNDRERVPLTLGAARRRLPPGVAQRHSSSR